MMNRRGDPRWLQTQNDMLKTPTQKKTNDKNLQNFTTPGLSRQLKFSHTSQLPTLMSLAVLAIKLLKDALLLVWTATGRPCDCDRVLCLFGLKQLLIKSFNSLYEAQVDWVNIKWNILSRLFFLLSACQHVKTQFLSLFRYSTSTPNITNKTYRFALNRLKALNVLH